MVAAVVVVVVVVVSEEDAASPPLLVLLLLLLLLLVLVLWPPPVPLWLDEIIGVWLEGLRRPSGPNSAAIIKAQPPLRILGWGHTPTPSSTHRGRLEEYVGLGVEGEVADNTRCCCCCCCCCCCFPGHHSMPKPRKGGSWLHRARAGCRRARPSSPASMAADLTCQSKEGLDLVLRDGGRRQQPRGEKPMMGKQRRLS